jgi:phosphoglycerate kinase
VDKLFLEELDLQSKRVLIRLDLNVPGDAEGNVTDDTRIEAALPTLEYCLEQGAALILCSHRGRPKAEHVPSLSLRPVAARLGELLDRPVIMPAEDPDYIINDEAFALADNLEAGQVMLLENLRYDKREKANDPHFAMRLASLADLFINDAFPVCHRVHASVVGVARYLPAAYGYQVRKEIEYMGRLKGDVERPYVGILGGAKVSTKLGVLETFLDKVDKLLIGGGLSYTFMAAAGRPIGRSIYEPDYTNIAHDMLEDNPDKIILAVDNYVVDQIGPEYEAQLVDRIPADKESVDIGEKTKPLFAAEIARAKTLFWNGPLGYFEDERFAAGTRFIAREVAKLKDTGALTVIGGGDSAAAIRQTPGLNYDNYSFVSTAGGAALEFVQGKVLPGLRALTDKA